MDIEKEVQARVDFKMSELLTAIENTAKANWGVARATGSEKHANYFAAFRQLSEMLKKEMRMPPPFDEMSEKNRIDKKNIAVENIMQRLCKKGERDYHHKASIVNDEIEKAQFW